MSNNHYSNIASNASTRLDCVIQKTSFPHAFSGNQCFNWVPNKDGAQRARWNGVRKSVSGQAILNSALVLLFLLLAPLKAQDLITILDLESDGSVSRSTIETVCSGIHEELTNDKRFMTSDRQYLPFMLESIEFQKKEQ